MVCRGVTALLRSGIAHATCKPEYPCELCQGLSPDGRVSRRMTNVFGALHCARLLDPVDNGRANEGTHFSTLLRSTLLRCTHAVFLKIWYGKVVVTTVSATLPVHQQPLATITFWCSLQIYSLSKDVESPAAFSYCTMSILLAQSIGLGTYGWVGWT